jgi:hypothetical protein
MPHCGGARNGSLARLAVLLRHDWLHQHDAVLNWGSVMLLAPVALLCVLVSLCVGGGAVLGFFRRTRRKRRSHVDARYLNSVNIEEHSASAKRHLLDENSDNEIL